MACLSSLLTSDQPRDEESKLLRLGAGRFATVFAATGGAFRALKLVKDNTRAAELEEEYNHLELIYTRCHQKGSFFRLPRPYSFHASIFAYAEVLNFPTTGILDHAMYSMQRVLPVPPALSSRIRAKFFPAQLRDGLKYKTFLARLYLGKYPQPPPESCNFPLTAEMLDELGLPVADIAEGMGRLLSRIHYLAGQDGRDIEFVLGGDKHDRPKFFCIDFDQMRDWDDVQQLVTSFTTNDPYYPRPGMMYWDAFKSAYLDEAPISASASARQFVKRLEQ
ncbi:hypothetical protein QJQ45_024005 [Haematococcus lacustris]|nr:hypothetical protein QJQ45_024005 [Haematococcus lacustris]